MHRVILGMRASSAARLNGVTTYVGDVGWSRQAHPPPGSRGHGNWQGEQVGARLRASGRAIAGRIYWASPGRPARRGLSSLC